MRKRIFTTLAMIMIIIVCMVPAAASAKTNLAEVNGKTYTDYKKAWDAVKKGGTIELLSDWKIKDTLKVSEKATVTIYANGHTIDRGLAQKKDSEGNGTVLSVGKNATANVHDGTLTGGCSDDYSSGIHIKEKARVNLYNVNVTGNRSEADGQDGHGGGVMLDGKDAYLYMYESHIDNNYAEEKGGGLYISDYNNCTVELDGNSSISNNEAATEYGGGVYINGQHATIIGHLDENGQPTSKISGNNTGADGGAIYVNSEHFLVKNVEISDNKAEVDGGGIYADNEDGTIEGCVIKNNIAKGENRDNNQGGGVYVDNDGWKIKDCTITENWTSHSGGGVFVTYSVEIAIEGNTVIKGNTEDARSSDLYLETDMNTKALIVDPSKITSGPGSIGITSGIPTDKRRLSADSGNFDETIFFSNNSNYVVKWDYDSLTKKGDKLLKLRAKSKVESELTEQVAPIEPTEPTEVTNKNEEQEEIQKRILPTARTVTQMRHRMVV